MTLPAASPDDISEAAQALLADPDDWVGRFITAFTSREAYGTFTKAAACAGISPNMVRKRQQRDPLFEAIYEDAKERLRDTLRYELHRRAMEPSERPVYHKGQLVDTILEYDNRHLEWLAERLMPEEFHLPLVVQFVGGDDADFTFRMGEADLPLELPPGDVIEHPDEPDQPVA